MSLNNEESSKINYRAKVEWYKERIASLSQGFVNPSARPSDPEPDSYRDNLDDLGKKADKLSKRIDDVSDGLKIPVNKDTDPDVSEAVNKLDPESGGAYVTYKLYKSLVEQVNAGIKNVKLEDIIEKSSNDINSNSQLIQATIYEGYAAYSGRSEDPDENPQERYVNRYLNNILSWNEHDYQIRQIINFSDNYLGMFPDPAHEAWAYKQDVLFERTKIDGFKGLWDAYSVGGKKELDRLGGALKDLQELRPDQNIADVTDRYIDYTNRAFNDINNLFNSNWSADLICCFVKYVVKLDLKTLKGIRALLQLLKSGIGFDFQDILGSFQDIFNNIMRGLILHELMDVLTQLVQRISDPINEWLNDTEDKWNKLFRCLPIKIMVDRYLMSAIEYAEQYLKDLLNELYKDIELRKIHWDAKWSLATDSKWINRALKLIDMVISAMELSSMCGLDESPGSDDANKIMDQVSNPNIYIYPSEENPNIYNSFITPEQQKAVEEANAAGDTAAAAKIMSQSSTPDAAAISKRLDDCRKNVMVEDLPNPIVWLEQLTQQSQGRA